MNILVSLSLCAATLPHLLYGSRYCNDTVSEGIHYLILCM